LISVLRAARAPGRIPALAAIAVAALIRIWDPVPLQELRLRVFDLEQRLLPRQSVGENSLVRIVQIDDESIGKYGQWPWPRTLVAQLVERIAAAHPRVLGIDILFSAPDRTSPPVVAKELPDLPAPVSEALAQLPSNETRLADALAKVPTVLGLALTDRAEGSTSIADGDPIARLPQYSGVVQSVPEVTKAAQAFGSITVEPDVDGVLRRLALVARYHDTLVPGLAAAVLAVWNGSPALPRVRTSSGGIEVAVGPVYVPADRTGAAWVYFTPQTPFYSASDILDGAVDPAQLEHKIVLLAVTSAGAGDVKRTPLGQMYGIEFHAQWLDGFFANTLLSRPAAAFWIELAAALIGGLAMVWPVRYERPLPAAVVAAGAVAVVLGGELLLFRFADWLVDGIYPAIATVAAFGAMLQGSLGAAQAARRRLETELQREREQRARTEGELAAARNIQMGLLPHRFPAFPERGDIDIYARIDPARSVGGDLFDYFLIDADRLFFIVADVSGKGPPAALFMVLTKEVVRAASARYDAALDRLLAEANNKIAGASTDLAEEGGDMMFVTAFAGILDLASGEILYASAGHDSPFVIRDGREPRQLATEGGPPLGAVEEFAFPLDRDHLEPGEVLLLYTDGVTEAQDKAGAFYSADRLAALLATTPAENAQSVVVSAFADVRRFAGDAEQADDITLLAIRRVAPG
jgi:serine phosphatase RsbU (regulator of sigma subunit)/CHASE2 domain-containing sensor protein